MDFPLIHTFEGHTDYVVSVCFSPCGKYICSSSGDSTIKLWDIESKKCIYTFKGHNVWGVCFSPCGKYICGCSCDKIKLWDIESKECIHTFEGHTYLVISVCFSPCGKYICSGSNDNTIKLWNIEGGSCPPSDRFKGTSYKECIHTFEGHMDYVTSVCFSPCGKYICSSSGDKTIKLWNCSPSEHYRCIHTFKGHTKSVVSICFSPCGKYICSGSLDNIVKLWDIEGESCRETALSTRALTPFVEGNLSCPPSDRFKGTSYKECIYTFEGHTDWVYSVCFSPCSNYICSSSSDKTIKLWDIETKECIYTFEGHTKWITSICFSSCGKYICSGSGDKTIKLWDVSNLNIIPYKYNQKILVIDDMDEFFNSI